MSVDVYMLNAPYIPNFGRPARWQEIGRGGTLYYPMWLAYSTGVVEERYRAKLVDAVAWEWSLPDVVRDVERHRPPMIVIDTSFSSLENDIRVAETLKHVADTTIVMVGPPTSQFADEMVRSPGVDIVARRDYDFTILETADAIFDHGQLQAVDGITYKLDGEVVSTPERPLVGSEMLDKIPFVSSVYKRHLNIRDYVLSSALHPEVQIVSSRGCPFLCTFCSWPQTFTGRVFRARSVGNFVDELEYISERIPEVREIVFEDDTFTIDKRRVLEICDEILRRGLDVTWNCQARVAVDYETMVRMKRAGCRLLIAGFESGNDSILRNIKKGTNVKQIEKFAADARKAGMLVHTDFIVGLPGETMETIENTRRLINKVKPDILQVSVAAPYPGTEFYSWALENGFIEANQTLAYLDASGHQSAVLSYPGLSAEEMSSQVEKILKEYYVSLRYVPIALRQVLRKNGVQELRRLFFAAKMFLRYIRG